MTQQKRIRTPGIPPDLTITEEVTDKHGRLKMEDRLLMDKGQCKMLGLTLQNSLIWDKHLSSKGELLPRVRSMIRRLHKVRQNTTKSLRLKLVNSLVLSKMSYGLSLWGNTSKTHLRKAQTAMNAAARLVTRSGKLTRQSDLFKECGWLRMEDWTSYSSLIQLWKACRWKIPTSLAEKLTIEDDELISTAQPRLLITKQTFRCNTVLTWNTLPDTLRAETSLVIFKKTLKKWLMESNDSLPDDIPPHDDRPPD